MKRLLVAGAALNQTPMDWAGNFQRIREAIQRAQEQHVQILCLPELCITGYGCEDMFFAPDVQARAMRMLYQLLPDTRGLVVSFGLPVAYQNRIFNCACLVVDGKIVGFTAKRFLAGEGVHYEPRWFTPWPQDQKVSLSLRNPLNGQEEHYPFGDVFFEIDGIKLGFEICEDAWVANRPGRRLYAHGVDLILNPSASHFAFGKFKTRQRFVLEGSRAFGVGYVYANLLGNEAGRVIYDGGVLIASAGKLLAEGQRLRFEEVCLTTGLLDIQDNRLAQAQASTVFNVPEVQQQAVKVENWNFQEASLVQKKHTQEAWERSPYIKEEEFGRAVALGLLDYLRKSYSQGFVVSLSGGADSSAICTCIWLMVKLGVEQLGLEKFKLKLAHIRGLEKAQSAEDCLKILLTTAYQSTRNSGEVTRRAAEELATAIHATHYELSVDELVEGYRKIVEGSLQRDLTWETDDIALQNIQARVRAPSVWMLANVRGALLLSTSNRSEAAVGYATMDGDTSGGLSPIAGIDKAFLRHWLRWMEREGIMEKYKLPALSFVNDQQPTAELRPQAQKQTDEDDLMPYEVLDAIEEAAIRDKKSPKSCLVLLEEHFPQYSKENLKLWVVRFFRLWSRNQWKRERYAPSFHLDDKNLDPKTWCRFPILSGGFAAELEAL